ncbi:MAG: URC4/urg3 family protein [Burkholderiaceae bacterium]
MVERRGGVDRELDAAVRVLRTPATIRQRCASIAAAVTSGESPHFTIDRSKLPLVAERVAKLTRTRYPDLAIPYHSRWRHFEAGGIDRKDELDRRLEGHSLESITRARIDLTMVSVLLDAGAGAPWRYVEPFSIDLTGTRYARSEGLAVASFRGFVEGRFSSDASDPCRVDAKALMQLDVDALATIFRASDKNPLVGLNGRAQMMRRLGEALHEQPQWFGLDGRPGMMFDALTSQAAANANSQTTSRTITAAQILDLLLDAFSSIWPSGQMLEGRAVGDVWPHPHAGGEGVSAGLVPFHKLSQWLTYSLLEPFEWAGVRVEGLDALTGLPEYRNGGLLLDAGVLVPRNAYRVTSAINASPKAPTGGQSRTPIRPPMKASSKGSAAPSMTAADPWIIEWRALTIALLDELAPLVRGILRVDASALPLACILEGGTWAAGRAIAAELRSGGAPPVTVESDGTVF